MGIKNQKYSPVILVPRNFNVGGYVWAGFGKEYLENWYLDIRDWK